jgi:hypothetical protein
MAIYLPKCDSLPAKIDEMTQDDLCIDGKKVFDHIHKSISEHASKLLEDKMSKSTHWSRTQQVDARQFLSSLTDFGQDCRTDRLEKWQVDVVLSVFDSAAAPFAMYFSDATNKRLTRRLAAHYHPSKLASAS